MSDFLQPHGLYSLPGPSVHRILQARTPEWVASPFSRESSPPRDWTPGLLHCSWVFLFFFFNHLNHQRSPSHTWQGLMITLRALSSRSQEQGPFKAEQSFPKPWTLANADSGPLHWLLHLQSLVSTHLHIQVVTLSQAPAPLPSPWSPSQGLYFEVAHWACCPNSQSAIQFSRD